MAAKIERGVVSDTSTDDLEALPPGIDHAAIVGPDGVECIEAYVLST